MEASRQVGICAIASRLKIIVTWLKFDIIVSIMDLHAYMKGHHLQYKGKKAS